MLPIIQPSPTGLEIPNAADSHRAAREWQGHLDAGRLTAATGPQTTPEIAANRARTEAIVHAHATATRAALREEN